MADYFKIHFKNLKHLYFKILLVLLPFWAEILFTLFAAFFQKMNRLNLYSLFATGAYLCSFLKIISTVCSLICIYNFNCKKGFDLFIKDDNTFKKLLKSAGVIIICKILFNMISKFVLVNITDNRIAEISAYALFVLGIIITSGTYIVAMAIIDNNNSISPPKKFFRSLRHNFLYYCFFIVITALMYIPNLASSFSEKLYIITYILQTFYAPPFLYTVYVIYDLSLKSTEAE